MGDWDSPEFVVRYNRVYGVSPREAEEILSPLELKVWDRFVDFGSGNGSFLAVAGRMAGLGVGVDASGPQLESARVFLAGIPQVRLVESGLLDFAWEGEPFTKAFSRRALHHLSDAEKALFFRKAARWLAPGSLFLIEDLILDFDQDRLDEMMPKVRDEAARFYGDLWTTKKPDFERCFIDEYPTGFPQWEAALDGGGFRVERREQKTCFYGAILARRGE